MICRAWEATYSGSDVGGTDVANVLDASLGSPDGCLLLDEAHDGSCAGAGPECRAKSCAVGSDGEGVIVVSIRSHKMGE